MDDVFVQRIYRMPRAQIGYLRFILESYDGLAGLRTIDSREALVEVTYPPSRFEDAEALLAALAGEFPMEEVPEAPAD